MAVSKSVSNRHLDKITGQLAFVKVLILLIVILLIAILVRADWKMENIQIIPSSKQTTSIMYQAHNTSSQKL